MLLGRVGWVNDVECILDSGRATARGRVRLVLLLSRWKVHRLKERLMT